MQVVHLGDSFCEVSGRFVWDEWEEGEGVGGGISETRQSEIKCGLKYLFCCFLCESYNTYWIN